MAHLLKVCKPEICCAIRNYGTQRYQKNHYETLNVSSDASQREIKRAFLRLSKQLHPDTSGKSSHIDFVKLNEAYSILGKESTRRHYDLDLKYARYNPSYTYSSPNTQYGSRWEYEVRTAGGPWPPPQQKPNEYFGLIVALIFFVMGLVSTVFMIHSMKVKRALILRDAQLEYEYKQIRNRARNKSNEPLAIENLNSVEDLNDYLAKNESDC